MASSSTTTMTSWLRTIKNKVIGNRLAKDACAHDGSIPKIIGCLTPSWDAKTRAEAAHVVASLCSNSHDALLVFLQSNALAELLQAIAAMDLILSNGDVATSSINPSVSTPATAIPSVSTSAPTASLETLSNSRPLSSDELTLASALVRALRSLLTACSDVTSPPIWGLSTGGSQAREEARTAIERTFQPQVLDLIMPLLAHHDPQISNHILHTLSAILSSSTPPPPARSSSSNATALALTRPNAHRTAISDWIPSSEKDKDTKGKRGWEKPAPVRAGGWAARVAIGGSRKLDLKTQEAALGALGALVRDNPLLAGQLGKGEVFGEHPPLQRVLHLARSRNSDVQMAACLCLAHIVRATPHASPPIASSLASAHISPPVQDNPAALSLLHILNNVIESRMPAGVRAKACFILSLLATDDKDLQRAALECGSVKRLLALLTELTPPSALGAANGGPVANGSAGPPFAGATGGTAAAGNTGKIGESTSTIEWDEDESINIRLLREGTLTAAATIFLLRDDIRPVLSDPLLLQFVSGSLDYPAVGVRYAAAQCVRAASRNIAPLRTGLVDWGLGGRILEVVKRTSEDRRVMIVALAAMCNFLNGYSPMRAVLIEQGGLARLVEFTGSEDPEIKLNAAWAIKNALAGSTFEEKKTIMGVLGWERLYMFIMLDPAPAVREQAITMLRNIASDAATIDLIFNGLGEQRILDALEAAFVFPDEDILIQASYALSNLSNGSPSRRLALLSRPFLLASLRSTLSHSKLEVRQAAVSCVVHLAEMEHLQPLRDAGIETTLRDLLGLPSASVSYAVIGSGALGSGSGTFGGLPVTSSGSGSFGSLPGFGMAGPSSMLVREDDKKLREALRRGLDVFERNDVHVEDETIMET